MKDMKSSGIEWIGEIPSDWKICRIKELFFEVNERCSNSAEYELLSVSEYYGVAPKAERISKEDMLTHAETLDGYKICRVGDIVMNIMLAWKRAMGVSKYEGIVSPAYCVYRAKREINPAYFHYLFRTDVYANLFKQFSTGIIDSRLRLYPYKFLALKCQVPPIKTQGKITHYLDDKCSKIDALIEKQQSSIERLKEYKLSVITEAVTSRNNWKAGHLGYLASFKNGLNYNGTSEEKEIKFLGVGDFKQHFILNREDMFSTLKFSGDMPEDLLLKNGDIVFVRSNGSKELVGRSVLIDNVDFPLTYSGFCIRMRNLRQDLVLNEFLMYCFWSNDFRQNLNRDSRGSNINNLNQELLSKLWISFPDMDEQKRIVNTLNGKCVEIENTISKKKQLITKLIEYKKSLIYEVVTGKREV